MRKYILLIDDDEEEFEIFSTALNYLQTTCRCIHASGAYKAIQLLDYIKPALIFVDVNMPQVNGFEMITMLKRIDKIKGKPLLLYSTGVTDEIAEMATKLGANGAVKKTDTIEELIMKLRQIFKTYDLLD